MKINITLKLKKFMPPGDDKTILRFDFMFID